MGGSRLESQWGPKKGLSIKKRCWYVRVRGDLGNWILGLERLSTF